MREVVLVPREVSPRPAAIGRTPFGRVREDAERASAFRVRCRSQALPWPRRLPRLAVVRVGRFEDSRAAGRRALPRRRPGCYGELAGTESRSNGGRLVVRYVLGPATDEQRASPLKC